MPRPSKKKAGDNPTSHSTEDLACQGKLPRSTTIAEDVIVAPRSAAKHASGDNDIGDDGNHQRNLATLSKSDKVTSEKPTRKKRDAPNTTQSENRRNAPRSSRKRAGDFNDFDGGDLEAVPVPDAPTQTTTTTKPTKKRKTAKTVDNETEPIEAVDGSVETEKVFPGGDRVEVESAVTSKPGRKQGKKTEKAEVPPESTKSVRKSKTSKKTEETLDEEGPIVAGDKDEELDEAAKDRPKRRGRPKKAEIVSENTETIAETTKLSKKIANKKAVQKPSTANKGEKAVTKESTALESTNEKPAIEEPTIEEAAQQPSKASRSKRAATKGRAAQESTTKQSIDDEPAIDEPAKKATTKDRVSKEPASNESAFKEPTTEEPDTEKGTQNPSKTSKGKKAVSKGLIPEKSAPKEPVTEEPTTEEAAKNSSKASKGRRPVSKGQPTNEPVAEKPEIKEPAIDEAVKPASKPSRGKKPAVEESATGEALPKPSQTGRGKKAATKGEITKESTTHDSVTEDPSTVKIPSSSKTNKNKEANIKSSTVKSSVSDEPIAGDQVVKESAVSEPAVIEPATEKSTSEKPANKKPAAKTPKRANKGEKVDKPATVDESAKAKSSKGRKSNKAGAIAEILAASPDLQTTKEPTDSTTTGGPARDEVGRGNAAGPSRETGKAVAHELQQPGNDGVPSGAPKSNKRKTPPGRDSDAIREVLDPLSELASSKKKQKKGLPQPVEEARTTISSLVAPIVDTVTHGVHAAKEFTAEVAGNAQSSILEDITAGAEETINTTVDEPERSHESAGPIVNDKATGKGKERVETATSKEADAGKSAIKAVEEPRTEGLIPDTTTQHESQLYREQQIEKNAQTSTILTGSGSGSTGIIPGVIIEEHAHRPYQSTIIELTQTTTTTVLNTVVQEEGQL